MIRSMGNFGIRIWLIALLAGPACFYFMPLLSEIFPGVPLVVTGGSLVVCLWLILGTLLDLAGKKKIEKLIKQGEIWERAGILSRAERTYIRAVRTYDTFLLSPFFAAKIASRLAGALARFSLTTGSKNPGFRLASAVYLKSNPGDETLAGLWLGQLKRQGQAGDLEQEVLTALANSHYTHTQLVTLLADVLLDLGRVDYAAKRIYTTLAEDPKLALATRKAYQAKIRELLGERVEPVERVERIEAVGRVRRAEPVERVEPAESVERMSDSRVVFISPHSIGRGKNVLGLAIAFPRTVKKGLEILGRALAACLSFCLLFGGRAITVVRERERVRFYLMAGGMGILSVWLLFFMGNTISHMLNSRAVEKEPKMIQVQAPKPFTIQVAAYLAKVHADRYAAQLKKKDLAAIVSEVGGGGKTWYVVRISDFSDKAAAAAFGEKLKSKKIIDDFFVSNK